MNSRDTNNHRPALVVMLTHNDFTVMDAAEIFERCKDSRAKCWGFKEHPLPLPQMKELYPTASRKTTIISTRRTTANITEYQRFTARPSTANPAKS